MILTALDVPKDTKYSNVYLYYLRLQTVKSFFEETLGAIPDSVLDAPISSVAIGFPDVFAAAKNVLPPPYTVREEELLYA